jgi:hypothetical protein
MEETLRYLGSFKIPAEAKQQGEVLFNIAWANEAEYSKLGMR